MSFILAFCLVVCLTCWLFTTVLLAVDFALSSDFPSRLNLRLLAHVIVQVTCLATFLYLNYPFK